jgi:hypothetical protein
MREEKRLITRFYRLLLAFYPADFRAEFGSEMEAVFTTAVANTQQSSGEYSWHLFWREIRDWPGSVLRAHQRERRRKMASKHYTEKTPLPFKEFVAALLVFLVPLFGVLTSIFSRRTEWVDNLLIVLFLGILLLGFGLAVIKRLPGWSFPYLGFLLMPVVMLPAYPILWDFLHPRFVTTFGGRGGWSVSTHVLYSAAVDFTALFLVLISAFLLVNLLRILPYTRSVWQAIRADWTTLSFLLYGGLVFMVAWLFDEYHYAEIPHILAWLVLALGAGLYLRVKGWKRQILALLGGATAAVLISAVARWIIVPLQTQWLRNPTSETRLNETVYVLVIGTGAILLLLAPALLNLLPGNGRTVFDEGEPVIT